MSAPYPTRLESHMGTAPFPKRITPRDCEQAGVANNFPSLLELAVRYWQAQRAGDPKAWLYKESAVRRLIRAQRDARVR